MALNPSTVSGRFLSFKSAALPPNALNLVSFTGQEAISRLYRFEVELASDKADLDLIRVLQQPAFLGIKQGVPMSGGTGRGIRNLRVHGILSSFEQGGKLQQWVAYRAVLVPRLWRLTLNVQSRIFLDKKVTEIVEEVLKDHGFTSEDYEFKMSAGSYPTHEYVVQYHESDFNFICRQLEHVGAFFCFVHGDDREKVVFGDSSSHYEVLVNPPTLPYRPAGAAGDRSEAFQWFDPEGIRALNVRSNLIPGNVVLRDYNWRTPSTDLKVKAPVVPDGYGTVYEYGNHYKDSGEGNALAKVRAEELKCRQTLFVGNGDCRAFRAAVSFELAEHYRPDFNQKYVITHVSHKASQSIVLGAGTGGPTALYENEFVAIPAKEAFRPERVTPKPKIAGTMRARVDAAGDGRCAEIDDAGRYKIQIPFDLSGKGGGKATRWIRMAQPYSGPNFGIHFPLHKGAEVLLTHIDGDPDRPIIASAVPNPETESPIKGGNQSQCMIRTGGGNQIMIEDTDGSERISLSSPHSKTSFSIGSAK